jgi:hypothetical protein
VFPGEWQFDADATRKARWDGVSSKSAGETRRNEEDYMRKFLMASAATLGAVGMAGAALAQAPTTAPMPPTPFGEGQYIVTPVASPPAYANTNNAYQAAALPGAVATPTPGTFVVKLNVADVVEASLQGSSFSTFTQAAGAPGATVVTPPLVPGGPTGTTTLPATYATAAGVYKQNAQSIQNYVRIYPGVDAMATNGMRYGAQVELRENWSTTTMSGGDQNSTSASGETSTQSMFIRRAFVYVASPQVGIIRFGQGDGVTGIFDNGVTSMQSVSPSSGMNGSDVQASLPANSYMGFPFYAQNGIEYGNQKIVYLSPSFAGLDIGLEYAPSYSNAEVNGLCADGVTTNPSALGATGVNAATCTTTSSSPLASDAARYTNQFEVGARYQGTFGPVAILAHATYMGSGVVDYTGALPSNHLPAGAGQGWNGKYNGISMVQGGAAVTVAGLTVGGLVNAGKMNNNGQGNPQPQGGVGQTAFIVGFQYNNGPLAVGLAYEQADSQGSPNLVGISQRHEWGVNPGVDWVLAPGMKVFAEYFYGQRHQGDYNFATGAEGTSAGATAYNDVRAQAFMVGTRVYW